MQVTYFCIFTDKLLQLFKLISNYDEHEILEKNEFSNTIQYNREYVMENLSDYHE